MSDLFPNDQSPRKQPADLDLNFSSGDLDDDDPEVVAGLARLRKLRAGETELPDIR